jgi:DNA-binding IclR family transcriptional regulator
MVTATPAAPSIHDLLERAKSEYREMPGVALNPSQAARLWHVPAPTAEHVLTTLAHAGFLTRAGRNTFVLASGSPLRRVRR